MACLTQSWSSCFGTYHTIFQILYPLLERRLGHLVKIVNPYQIVSREYLRGETLHNGTLLLAADFQMVLGVHAYKVVLPHIQVVSPLSEVEIEYADGVDFFHLLIGVAQVDVLGYGLGYSVEYAFKVIKFACILNFNYDNLAFGVFGLYVDAVKLIVLCLLVALALKYVHNFHLLANEYGEEALEHIKIGLLPQQPLYGPVKSYVSVL